MLIKVLSSEINGYLGLSLNELDSDLNRSEEIETIDVTPSSLLDQSRMLSEEARAVLLTDHSDL